mgnify:CR=1 FL=1
MLACQNQYNLGFFCTNIRTAFQKTKQYLDHVNFSLCAHPRYPKGTTEVCLTKREEVSSQIHWEKTGCYATELYTYQPGFSLHFTS